MLLPLLMNLGMLGQTTTEQRPPRPADNEKKKRRTLHLPFKPTGLIDRPKKAPERVFAEAPSVEQRVADAAVIAKGLADTEAREQALRAEQLLIGMQTEAVRTEEIRRLLQLAILEEEEEEILMMLAMDL